MGPGGRGEADSGCPQELFSLAISAAPGCPHSVLVWVCFGFETFDHLKLKVPYVQLLLTAYNKQQSPYTKEQFYYVPGKQKGSNTFWEVLTMAILKLLIQSCKERTEHAQHSESHFNHTSL